MSLATRKTGWTTHPSFARLSLIHLFMATLILLLVLFQLYYTNKFQYVTLSLILLQFLGAQLYALRLSADEENISKASQLVITSLAFSVLVLPLLLSSSLIICLPLLATVPQLVIATDQLKRLPYTLFISFMIAALTISIDLISPWTALRLQVSERSLFLSTGAALFLYFSCLVIFFFKKFHLLRQPNRTHLRINLATQYALVISGISAMVIILVTSVLIHQIRQNQIDQVGKNFQTIAENFAKLAGSHLEQQMQKLQLLTQQVPILKQSLLEANKEYTGDRKAALKILAAKDRLWQRPKQNNSFIMNYLNSPILEALSRFRGNNSFHNDILFVDGYGGLVASLGQKPARFYFYDQNWWQVSWNDGLGNIFIGDLQHDDSSQIPKVRIAVDIVDHATNKVIGMLSSRYLLRTLIEDIQRFMPESVEQISLLDADGAIISSTSRELSRNPRWPQLQKARYWMEKPASGWELGNDHLKQPALIGFSSLSTAYNVISDPLHRLGWHIVVSGSTSKALSGVNQSTKLAMLVGLGAMALGVLVAIAAARVVTRPIENLTETASAMNDGNLENRAELAGPEELVALAESFNTLTNQLNRVISNLKSQTVQLAKAKTEAEAATKLKGEFLAHMSHEIRTPLNAILGFAEILESTLGTASNRSYAKIIKTSGTDLLHLINEILDLSKIEAGRMEIQKSPIDIRRLFKELRRIFSISAGKKNIKLTMEVAPEVPHSLLLDGIRLKQVLFNLIGNAVKFTEQGSVHYSAQILPGDSPRSMDLQIEVDDTGIGIDPRNFNAIFRTFRQENIDPKASFEGTGLGLTISKNLVEMMGGSIRVEGEQSKGAKFTIHLPDIMVADSSTEHKNHPAESGQFNEIQFKEASLLIVDDLEVNRRLLMEKLKDSPFTISQAENGAKGLRLAKENSYDLILMDIRMPDMDGYAVLQGIRKEGLTTDVPIIAITASGMKDEISRIVAAGFDAFLISPFDQTALVNLLTQFLPYHKTCPKEQENEEVTGPDTDLQGSRSGSTIDQWLCPPQVEEYLQNSLEGQWRKVMAQQSIPEIRLFANNVENIGDLHRVELLSQYGKELSEYADAVDIEHVEKMLNDFKEIMACRKPDTT